VIAKKTATTNEKKEINKKKLRPICIFQEDFTFFFFVLNFSNNTMTKQRRKRKKEIYSSTRNEHIYI